jgi:hypothetical protein
MTNEFDDMLRTDPLAEAEKLTGKSYKDDEATASLGFLMHIAHNERKEKELGLRDDTFFRTPFVDTLRIYTELGFELVYHEHFRGKDDAGMEQYVILWRDGILATIDSYTWSTGDQKPTTNSNNFYYNWMPSTDDFWDCTSSGHFITEAYDQGRKIWSGYHDGREALRHNLARMESKGTFLPEWEERAFLWLGNREEQRDLKWNDPKRNKITARIIAHFPQHVQDALGAPRA